MSSPHFPTSLRFSIPVVCCDYELITKILIATSKNVQEYNSQRYNGCQHTEYHKREFLQHLTAFAGTKTSSLEYFGIIQILMMVMR